MSQRDSVEPLIIDVRLLCPPEADRTLVAHFIGTRVAGVQFRAVSTTAALAGADVVWLAPRSFGDGEWDRHLTEALSRGALLVTHGDGVSVRQYEFGSELLAPVRRRALLPLQSLLKNLVAAFDAPALEMLFDTPRVARFEVDNAESLLETAAAEAVTALVRKGAGEVLFLGLTPRIDGAGFSPENHIPARATAWQLLADAVLAYAFERKHGLAIIKQLGPSGAPALAWQAHVEEMGGVACRCMERFTTRLASSRQVPSFSLIRHPFRWGRRTPGIVYLPTRGAGGDVDGQPDGSAFFSGQWVRCDDDTELGFEDHRTYCDYYTPSAGGRVYPAPMPNGKLVIGTPDGRLETFKVVLEGGRVSLRRLGPLSCADGTPMCALGPVAPTVGWTDVKRPVLALADEHGTLNVFRLETHGWVAKEQHVIAGLRSPRLVDWKGNGTLDLIAGMDDGSVVLFEDFEQLGPAKRTTLLTLDGKQPVPFPVVGSRRELLIGEGGKLWRWCEGSLEPLRTNDYSILGTREAYLQQDVVPVVVECGGHRLLLVGAAVVGAPRQSEALESSVKASIAVMRRVGLPINAHFFCLPAMSLGSLNAELVQHRDRFAALGAPWHGVGANQHCWWLPKGASEQAFLAQWASGLCFNSGWQSPSTRASPDGSAEFALNIPFLLTTDGTQPGFLLFNPLPPGRFERATEVMLSAGLPCSLFTHPEYRYDGAAGAELDEWLGRVEVLRQRYGAVCVTEQQLAKAAAVALATEVRVSRDETGAIVIEANASRIPAWAADSAESFAVRVWSTRDAWQTDSKVQRRLDDGLVTTVAGKARLVRGDQPNLSWTVSASNGPITVHPDRIEVHGDGFQEVHIASQRELELDWPGAHRRETPHGTVLTRFGAPSTVRVREWPVKAATQAVQWTAHPSKQDQWVIRTLGHGQQGGFFVELGAADGVSSSSTCALERHFGWKGIAVEPNQLFFEQLKRNRACAVENACVAEASGTVDFIEASWFGRIRNHALPDLADGDHLSNPFLREDLDGTPARVTSKRALSLEDLLIRHHAPRVIDFVCIDAEYSEWFILKPFPFDRFEVRTLCVHSKFWWEGRMVDSADAGKIREHLRTLGFFYDREHSRNVEYDFFLHPKLVSPPHGMVEKKGNTPDELAVKTQRGVFDRERYKQQLARLRAKRHRLKELVSGRKIVALATRATARLMSKRGGDNEPAE